MNGDSPGLGESSAICLMFCGQMGMLVCSYLPQAARSGVHMAVACSLLGSIGAWFKSPGRRQICSGVELANSLLTGLGIPLGSGPGGIAAKHTLGGSAIRESSVEQGGAGVWILRDTGGGS